ncbi:MAG: helix-turn-helix domain-containing protein [Afipia sp.]
MISSSYPGILATFVAYTGKTKPPDPAATNEKPHMTTGWHRAEIVAAVRMRKSSLAELARKNRLADATLRAALSYPRTPSNTIISKFLGVPLHELWPAWFDEQGRLIRPVAVAPKHGGEITRSRQTASSQKRTKKLSLTGRRA